MARLRTPVPPEDRLLCDFARRHEGTAIFADGPRGERILLSIAPGRHYQCFDGNVDAARFLEVYREAGEAGLLTAPMSVLVDYTRFTGVIDWRVVAEVDRIKPFGDFPPAKVAIVLRDDELRRIVKLKDIHNPGIAHADFPTEDDAKAWLGWD